MNTQSSETKMHESLCIALILALMGGFLDAYTYILKNGKGRRGAQIPFADCLFFARHSAFGMHKIDRVYKIRIE